MHQPDQVADVLPALGLGGGIDRGHQQRRRGKAGEALAADPDHLVGVFAGAEQRDQPLGQVGVALVQRPQPHRRQLGVVVGLLAPGQIGVQLPEDDRVIGHQRRRAPRDHQRLVVATQRPQQLHLVRRVLGARPEPQVHLLDVGQRRVQIGEVLVDLGALRPVGARAAEGRLELAQHRARTLRRALRLQRVAEIQQLVQRDGAGAGLAVQHFGHAPVVEQIVSQRQRAAIRLLGAVAAQPGPGVQRLLGVPRPGGRVGQVAAQRRILRVSRHQACRRRERRRGVAGAELDVHVPSQDHVVVGDQLDQPFAPALGALALVLSPGQHDGAVDQPAVGGPAAQRGLGGAQRVRPPVGGGQDLQRQQRVLARGPLGGRGLAGADVKLDAGIQRARGPAPARGAQQPVVPVAGVGGGQALVQIGGVAGRLQRQRQVGQVRQLLGGQRRRRQQTQGGQRLPLPQGTVGGIGGQRVEPRARPLQELQPRLQCDGIAGTRQQTQRPFGRFPVSQGRLLARQQQPGRAIAGMGAQHLLKIRDRQLIGRAQVLGVAEVQPGKQQRQQRSHRYRQQHQQTRLDHPRAAEGSFSFSCK